MIEIISFVGTHALSLRTEGKFYASQKRNLTFKECQVSNILKFIKQLKI